MYVFKRDYISGKVNVLILLDLVQKNGCKSVEYKSRLQSEDKPVL